VTTAKGTRGKAGLEKELLRRQRDDTREQHWMRLFWYIECFYDAHRPRGPTHRCQPKRVNSNSNGLSRCRNLL